MGKQIFGIHQLYCPKTEPVVDVVAVHGLMGDALQTWTSEKTGVCWLKDPTLLPSQLPNARILTWGYNANVASMAGRTASSDRILEHAQTLISDLVYFRQSSGGVERPIIFICHSLGGIVVKRALTYSESRTSHMIDHLHSIYTCTFAIMFFGTPHHGSGKAKTAQKATGMLRRCLPKRILEIEPALLKALEENSEVLQDIADQFAPLMSRYSIYFFWESESTDLGYTRAKIVDTHSAAPMIDNTARSGIAADHKTMCKFESPSSPGYRTACAALMQYTQEATAIIRSRVHREKVDLREMRKNKAAELLMVH